MTFTTPRSGGAIFHPMPTIILILSAIALLTLTLGGFLHACKCAPIDPETPDTKTEKETEK